MIQFFKKTFFTCSATCLIAGVGFSQTIVIQEGVNGYSGTVDTFIMSGGDNVVNINGDLGEFEWDGEDGGGANYGLLKFEDLVGTGANQVAPNTVIESAILTLTVTNEGAADQIATVHHSLLPFDEQVDFLGFTVNFELVPGEDYADDVLAEIPGPSAGDIIDVDLTDSVQAIINGADNLGWVFVPGGTNGVGIQSSEVSGAVVPELFVSTSAGDFTFRDGLNGYDGTIDTWLNTGDGAIDVNGGNTWFEWDGSDNGGANFGLLRFEGIIGAGAIPPGSTINSAVIRLQIQDGGDTATLHEILAGSEAEPTAFDEENTTMLDFGDTFEPRAGVDYNETSLADVPGVVGPIELDVTSSLQSLSDGADNLGWIFVPGGGGGVEAVSGEGSSSDAGPPKLTITVSGGPVSVDDYSIY